MEGLFYLAAIIWLPIAFFTSTVAGEKGFPRSNWWVGGLFFGPIALLAAVGLPDRKKQYVKVREDEPPELVKIPEGEQTPALVPIDSKFLAKFLLFFVCAVAAIALSGWILNLMFGK